MKNEIVKYLKDKYEPQAIILHGSRAKGGAVEHSDWDFFLLDEEKKDIRPEQYNGESLDIQRVDPNLEKEEIVDTYGPEFLGAEVVYDFDGVGEDFLHKAQSAAEDGPELSKKDIESRRNYILRYLHRMQDRKHKPGAFFWYVSEFYVKAMQYWYELLHDEWAEPEYKAIDEIKERDPEYFSLLKVLYRHNSAEEKIEAAQEILDILFSENHAK